MEQQKVEELEAVEQETFTVKPEPKLQEYEKLLLAESNRQNYEKALNLVKFGCFEQRTETTVDFNKYIKIEGRKFKGFYELYQNLETMELVFICPLVEEDKADLENKKEVAPYAYDCIFTNAMDEETYQLVKDAAKKNLTSKTKVLFILSFVAYCLFMLLGLVGLLTIFIYIVDKVKPETILEFMASFGIYGGHTILVGGIISTLLIVLLGFKYNKYKGR